MNTAQLDCAASAIVANIAAHPGHHPTIGDAVDVYLSLDLLSPSDEEFRSHLLSLVATRLCGNNISAADALAGRVQP